MESLLLANIVFFFHTHNNLTGDAVISYVSAIPRVLQEMTVNKKAYGFRDLSVKDVTLFIGIFIQFMAISLITSPAMIRPITEGTKDRLPGTRRLSPSAVGSVMTGGSFE